MPGLYKAMLLHSFGHGSPHPARTCGVRVGILIIGAVVTAVGLGRLAAQLPLIPMPVPVELIAPAFMTIQCLVILVLTSALSLAIDDTHARLLQSMPLKPYTRRSLLLLPELILAALAMISFGVPLAIIFYNLGLPSLLIGVSFGGGIYMAFVVRRILQHLAVLPRLIFVGGYIASQYYLVRLAIDVSAAPLAVSLAYSGLVAVCIGAVILASAMRTIRPKYNQTAILSGRLPIMLWPLLQACRHPTIRTGALTAFGLSVLAVLALWRSGSIDVTFIASMTGLLAAVTAADMRTVARRLRPAESTALRGTMRFMQAHIVAAYCLIPLAIMPLGILYSLYGGEMLPLLATLSLGIASGILSGTCIVPAPRDISAQFAATLGAGGIIFGLPQVAPIFTSPGGLITASIVLCCGALAIEYKRNRYLWRYYVRSS